MSDEQFQLLWEQLNRIGNALEVLAAAVMLPDEEPTPEPCSHPPDQRTDFGMTNGQEDWQCRICNYRSLT